MIALLRPNAWDLPLFLHVLGATALFGGVLALALLSFSAQRIAAHSALLRRLAFVTTLAVVWPAFIVMRIGAQWIASKEHLDKNSPGWIDTGFIISDAGIVLLLLLTILGWLATRRAKAGLWLAGLSTVYLAALGVAWWAMTTRPGA